VVPIEQAVALAERKIGPVSSGSWPTDKRNFRWGA
jgi:hypothetical protein